MRRTLSHQVWQEIYIILAQFLDLCLLFCIVLSSDDLIHPPFVTGRGAEHTAHQMIASVCMGKGMKGIVRVHAELFAGDKDRTAGPKGNIAHAVSYGSCTYRCGCIVACPCHNLAGSRDAQVLCKFRLQCAYCLIAFKKLWHLSFCDSADIQHLFRPAAVLYIQKQHTGGI